MIKSPILLALLLFFSISLFAQIEDEEATDEIKAPSDTTGLIPKDRNFQFVPFPKIQNNQVFGWGGGINLVGLYKLNPKDTVASVSMTAIQPCYFQNGTYWVAFYQKYHFNEDKHILTFLLYTSNFNYQFYTEDFVPADVVDPHYENYVGLGYSAMLRYTKKITKGFYMGIHGKMNRKKLTFENELLNDYISMDGKNVFDEVGLGVTVNYDTRDHGLNASEGLYVYVHHFTYSDKLGGDVNYTSVDSEIAYYFKPLKKVIIASKATINTRIGDNIPFTDQAIMGFGGEYKMDLRGYNKGQYRGNQFYCFQSEIRWNFYNKLSLNGFGGVGTVFSKDTEKPVLPAGGLGMRYLASEKYNFVVGVDYAWGKDDNGIYFQIGQAF